MAQISAGRSGNDLAFMEFSIWGSLPMIDKDAVQTHLVAEIHRQHEEIERLRAQNEKLDAALKKAHDEIDRLTGYTDAISGMEK